MFNQVTANAICERLARGESLRGICADAHMPDHSTVLKWAREREDFGNQYARAREDGDDYEFEGLEVLADEAPQLTQSGSVDAGWVAWQKNRIDVRKWTLARKRPKKYGDKMDLNHSGRILGSRELSEAELVNIAAGSGG